MLLYGIVWVSLIWMYWTEVRTANVLNVANVRPSQGESK